MSESHRSLAGELTTLARLFVKLSLTSFGGPAAHTAMMEDEVVVRRKWLSRQSFLDLVGAVNLIPGPNSTEMIMHYTKRLEDWRYVRKTHVRSCPAGIAG